MDKSIWDLEYEKIEPQELTEREKKLAEECAEIELEFQEAISMINSNEEER